MTEQQSITLPSMGAAHTCSLFVSGRYRPPIRHMQCSLSVLLMFHHCRIINLAQVHRCVQSIAVALVGGGCQRQLHGVRV